MYTNLIIISSVEEAELLNFLLPINYYNKMSREDKRRILQKLTDEELSKLYVSIYTRNYTKGIKINPKKEFKGHLNRQKRMDLILEYGISADFNKQKTYLKGKLRLDEAELVGDDLETETKKPEEWELPQVEQQQVEEEIAEAVLDNKDLEGTGLKWENGQLKEDEDLPNWKRLGFSTEQDYEDFLKPKAVEAELEALVAREEALRNKSIELKKEISQLEAITSNAITDTPPQRTITLKGIEAHQEITTRVNFTLKIEVVLLGERLINLDKVIEALREDTVVTATTLVEQNSQKVY